MGLTVSNTVRYWTVLDIATRVPAKPHVVQGYIDEHRVKPAARVGRVRGYSDEQADIIAKGVKVYLDRRDRGLIR